MVAIDEHYGGNGTRKWPTSCTSAEYACMGCKSLKKKYEYLNLNCQNSIIYQKHVQFSIKIRIFQMKIESGMNSSFVLQLYTLLL